MFTGIIQTVGTVSRITSTPPGRRLRIDCAALDPQTWRTGDSVAVAGCCLTALDIDASGFSADLSAETLSRSSLGALNAGDPVNLELALAVGERLGGHFVSGHVDGLADLVNISASGDNRIMRFALPDTLARFVVEKGSVTLDGVSLTVNATTDDHFEVNLIPHTLAATTLGRLESGDRVNLEVDLLARYLERLMRSSTAQ